MNGSAGHGAARGCPRAPPRAARQRRRVFVDAFGWPVFFSVAVRAPGTAGTVLYPPPGAWAKQRAPPDDPAPDRGRPHEQGVPVGPPPAAAAARPVPCRRHPPPAPRTVASGPPMLPRRPPRCGRRVRRRRRRGGAAAAAVAKGWSAAVCGRGRRPCPPFGRHPRRRRQRRWRGGKAQRGAW